MMWVLQASALLLLGVVAIIAGLVVGEVGLAVIGIVTGP